LHSPRRAAAGDADVAIAGGAATVNQYLAAELIDELRLHVAPALLGAGERLFDGVGNVSLEPLQVRQTALVTHLSNRIDSHELWPCGTGAFRGRDGASRSRRRLGGYAPG
jgi:dihydrofolate reductase